MRSVRLTVSLAFVLAACGDEAECLRKVDVANLQATEDAATCSFDLEGLEEPDCGLLDRRPLQTYLAVFCGVSDVSCLRGDPSIDAACFGDADTPEAP